MIVAAADAPLARQIAETLSPAGERMWLTGLSATGAEPASHFVSTGYIGDAFAALMPLQAYAMDEQGNWNAGEFTPGHPAMIVAACAAAESPLTLAVADVADVLARADVTEQEPFTAFARLGLQLVQGEA